MGRAGYEGSWWHPDPPGHRADEEEPKRPNKRLSVDKSLAEQFKSHVQSEAGDPQRG